MGERKTIKSIEKQLCSNLNPKRLAVHGSGNSGYEALSDYLGGRREADEPVKKQLHEYRVFLTILNTWADPIDVEPDDIIHFSPEKGTGVQFETAPSLFVEPALPIYPEQNIWNKHHPNFNYLNAPDTDVRRHTKPDMLLTRDGVNTLPWTAIARAPVKNESKLMSWCAHGEGNKVKQELGIEQEISSTKECYSIVQNVAEKYNSKNLHEKWKNFEEKAEYLIESKHGQLKESDFSQILWYGLAYNVDIIIITNHQIHDRQFYRDLDKLPVNVDIIDDFETTINMSEANSKISAVI
jgi:hypothetical protein